MLDEVVAIYADNVIYVHTNKSKKSCDKVIIET